MGVIVLLPQMGIAKLYEVLEKESERLRAVNSNHVKASLFHIKRLSSYRGHAEKVEAKAQYLKVSMADL